MAKPAQRGIKTKEKVENFCLTCGEKAEQVLIAPFKGRARMFWRCENDHVHKTRRYEVRYYK